MTIKKRVPVNLSVGGIMYNAFYTGQYTADLYLDPQRQYNTALWTCEAVGTDDSPGYGIQNSTLWDFGGELVFSRKEKVTYSMGKELIVQTPDDIEKLKLPNLETAPAFQYEIQFNDIQIANGKKVVCQAGSMLEHMQQLAGTKNVLRWLVKHPEQMHVFYRKITDYLCAKIDYKIERYGASNLSLMGTYQLDNDMMISRKIFEKMSLPYIIEIHDRFVDAGICGWLIHLCGDHRKSLHYWLEEIRIPKHTAFWIGTEMDIEKTAKLIGDQHAISGNLANTLIQTGSPLELYDETKELVLKMKHHAGGFILRPDCSLTVKAPPANLYAIVKACREFGDFE